MPTLRLLAASASALGSPGTRDIDGNAVFAAAPGNVEKLTLDFNGWLGGETLSASTWATDLTTSGETNSAGIASALATVPASSAALWPDTTAYLVTHTATASSGRKRVTKLYLAA